MYIHVCMYPYVHRHSESANLQTLTTQKSELGRSSGGGEDTQFRAGRSWLLLPFIEETLKTLILQLRPQTLNSKTFMPKPETSKPEALI